MRQAGSKAEKYLAVALCSFLGCALIVAVYQRGTFFREDYLPCFSTVSIVFAAVAAVAAFRGESLWHADGDLALVALVGLYWLSTILAKSKMLSLEGALKYSIYLMLFLVARYATQSSLGSRLVKNLIVLSGVVAAGAGYLTAAGVMEFPDSIMYGSLLGSLQYPNALAAYAMFVSFLLLDAWDESSSGGRLPHLAAGMAYSTAAFLTAGAIVLSDSRATWIVYVIYLAVFIVMLPWRSRLQVAGKLAVMYGGFLSVASPLAKAILDGNTASVKSLLLRGVALTMALEALRFMSVRVLASQWKKTMASDRPADPRSRRTYLWSGIIVAMVVVVLAFSATGKSFLSKILPASVIQNLRTIGLHDQSITIRIIAARDALSIAVDHPFGTGAGGWQALYHQYQRVPYWFTEAHNHVAQVLVETGFPGLVLYLCFWAFLVYGFATVYIRLLHGNSADSAAISHLVAIGVAVFALGTHSVADFDLSIPAISMGFYVAIGALLSELTKSGFAWRVIIPTWSHADRSSKHDRHSKGVSRSRPITGENVSTGIVATILSAVVLTSAVYWPSQRLFRGIITGNAGARALIAKDYAQGERLILAASKDDPGNSGYIMNLAKARTAQYLETGDQGTRVLAKLYLELSRTKDPTNLERQLVEANLLSELAYRDEAVESAHVVVRMMPLEIEFHEVLSRFAKDAIDWHLMGVKSGLGQATQEDLQAAARFSDWVLEETRLLAEAQKRVTGLYTATFAPKGLDVTPKIAMTAGQAAYLHADAETTLKYLTLAATDKTLSTDAAAWLSYLGQAAGVKVALPSGYKPNASEVQRMVSLWGIAK